MLQHLPGHQRRQFPSARHHCRLLRRLLGNPASQSFTDAIFRFACFPHIVQEGRLLYPNDLRQATLHDTTSKPFPYPSRTGEERKEMGTACSMNHTHCEIIVLLLY